MQATVSQQQNQIEMLQQAILEIARQNEFLEDKASKDEARIQQLERQNENLEFEL